MSSWKKAKWRKGKREITGSYVYVWSRDRFAIVLDTRDKITGAKRTLEVAGDKPEFNGWVLVEDKV